MTSWDRATGTHYDYDHAPEKEKVYSKDGSKAMCWYEARNRSDRYDDDTLYKLTVWEVTTKKEITTFYYKHNYSLMTGTESGGWVEEAKFNEAGTSITVKTSDGKVRDETLPG